MAEAPKLHSDVLERLQQDIVLSETARELVLAALLGEVEVCLGGKTPAAPATESAEPEDPARAYIDAVRVQGFRGVGPSAELALSPGPGLTLVVGRNGSGKSSFAEALELLLTGDNQRWSSKRSRVPSSSPERSRSSLDPTLPSPHAPVRIEASSALPTERSPTDSYPRIPVVPQTA